MEVVLSLGQVTVFAIVHAVFVAGTVLATLRGRIANNESQTTEVRESLYRHKVDNTRHVNSELIEHQLREINSKLGQLPRRHTDTQ